MTQFLQQLVNGLSLGSIYALIALGYTMVYGIIKLINFAHGDIYMLGAFTAFYATTVFHLNFFLALIVAMVLCGVLGVLIERIAFEGENVVEFSKSVSPSYKFKHHIVLNR